jgi:hypothetical protein
MDDKQVYRNCNILLNINFPLRSSRRSSFYCNADVVFSNASEDDFRRITVMKDFSIKAFLIINRIEKDLDGYEYFLGPGCSGYIEQVRN